MYNQFPKATGGCLTIIAISLLFITYLGSGSFNPLSIYTSGSISAKIIVSFLAFLFVSLLMQILGNFFIRKSVEIGEDERAEDVICPGCGKPLIKYSSSHGLPIRCPKCLKSWHNGPSCYNKGMSRSRIVIPTYPCPKCRSGSSEDQDLFDDDYFTN
jgi:ribosomal protein L37AE/L43A